jgi:hypothetical protein
MTGYLEVPGWPQPQPDRDFVRAAGAIKEDSTWGLEGWISERYYCQAKRAIRFHEFPSIRFSTRHIAGRSPKHMQLRVSKRSFFFDGMAVAKLEITFSSVTQVNLEERTCVSELIDRLANIKLSLPVLVGSQSDNRFEYHTIALAGASISRFLTAATSSRSGLSTFEQNKRWLKPGKPILFLELDEQESVEVDSHFQCAKLLYPWQMQLLHGRQRTMNRTDVPIWILRKSPGFQTRFSNAARIFLVRLHCEHECIRATLDAIQRGEVYPPAHSAESDFLQQYLNDATRNIYNLNKKFRTSSDGRCSADPVDTVELWARASLDHMQAGDRSALHSRLKSLSIRRNIEIKALRYLEDDEEAARYVLVNNYGSLVMADQRLNVSNSSNVSVTQVGRDAHVRLESSFSAAQGSNARLDVIQKLAELKALIGDAIQQGRLGDPTAVARDFQDLANEVASERPRGDKMKSTGAYILEGIKTAADLVKPAGELITAITSAFG